MAESEEELKSLLMKMKVESEKVGSQAPLPMGFSRQEYWSGVPLPLLKLKLQYFGHLMQRVDSLEKTDAGRDWEQERRGRQRMRWLDGITDSTDVGLGEL